MRDYGVAFIPDFPSDLCGVFYLHRPVSNCLLSLLLHKIVPVLDARRFINHFRLVIVLRLVKSVGLAPKALISESELAKVIIAPCEYFSTFSNAIV